MTMGAWSGNVGDDPSQPTPLSVVAVASTMRPCQAGIHTKSSATFSMYASHVGQGKEATQVAMKHTILDLKKEAAAQDAMFPPLLVALTVIVTTVDYNAANLQSLARYLSGADKKSLLAQFKPLAQDLLPKATNLLAWW